MNKMEKWVKEISKLSDRKTDWVYKKSWKRVYNKYLKEAQCKV